jgi:amino acid transporter
MTSAPTLKHQLGFWALVAYGVGDILGAGIYALMGKGAGIAGVHAWLAFAVALVVAALTTLSFAELSSRYPRSAGVAAYCQEAFHDDRVAFLVGWLMLCAGIVSMATIARAFSGYVAPLLPDWPAWGPIVGFLLALTGLNLAGIRQASAANILCTLIEASGLVVVIVVGLRFWAAQEGVALSAPQPELTGSGLLQAGALILVKRRPHTQAAFQVPLAVPAVGLMVSLGLVGFLPPSPWR